MKNERKNNNKFSAMAKELQNFNWTDKPVIGLSLLVMGGEIDSFGNQIRGDIYYTVGKNKTTGQVAIISENENIAKAV